jgi:hypothetical protein
MPFTPTNRIITLIFSSVPSLLPYLRVLPKTLRPPNHRHPPTAFETDNGRSGLGAGTALHAPLRPLPRAAAESVGWEAVIPFHESALPEIHVESSPGPASKVGAIGVSECCGLC